MYKIQAKHKTGYYAPYMFVAAENEQAARMKTRLNDFQDDWTIYVSKK